MFVWSLTMPRKMPEAKETWLRVAKAPRRLIGDTPWIYSGFRLITRPQKRPKMKRPTIRSSKALDALLRNIRPAPTIDKMFAMRMAFLLQEKKRARVILQPICI